MLHQTESQIVPRNCFHQKEGNTGMKWTSLEVLKSIQVMDWIHLHPSESELKGEVLKILLLNHHLCFCFLFFLLNHKKSCWFTRSMLKCIPTGESISSCSLISQQVVRLTNSERCTEMSRQHIYTSRNAALLLRYPNINLPFPSIQHERQT